MYIGLKVRNITRSKKLIIQPHYFGLNLLLLYSSAEKSPSNYCMPKMQRTVVCSSQFRTGRFTASTLADLECNLSGTKANDSFDGTGIGVLQQTSTTSNPRESRELSLVLQRLTEKAFPYTRALPLHQRWL